MQSFRELKIWQCAREIVKEVYILTSKFPQSEKFGLISQMNRSAVSIPSNIAEGFGRFSNKDFARFLRISLGSLYELETQLILSTDLKFLDEMAMNPLIEKLHKINFMILAFMKKLI